MRYYTRKHTVIFGLVGFALLFTLWELASARGLINPVFFPPLEKILVQIYVMFAGGSIYQHIQFSLTNFGIGFALAVGVAIPLGIVIGWYESLYRMFDPLISALFATPLVVLIPLVILIFGIYSESKIVMTFLAGFFPLLINVMQGVRKADAGLIEMARSFGAGDGRVFRTVVLPCSIPFIITGLRVSLTRALVFIIVVEQYASVAGLGYLTSIYAQYLRTAEMFATIFIIAALAVFLVELIKYWEGRVEAWRPR